MPLVALAAQVADHGALRPWRLIELRGEARERLGEALAAASGHTGMDRARLVAKPLRAELLIAVVACRRDSAKVADWEQDVAAAGVGHALSLLLDDAGWGVMWRTGPHTRSAAVREMHDLSATEELLGWLYVGGIPDDARPAPRPPLAPEDFLTAL